MAENKTKPTKISVASFIAAVADERRRADSKQLIALMQKVTGEKPAIWGPSIVGFGTHHYVYESGREGDMPIVAFSPRKPAVVLYALSGAPGADALLGKMGKFTMGKGCIYVKTLADIDLKVLERLVTAAFKAKTAKAAKPKRGGGM